MSRRSRVQLARHPTRETTYGVAESAQDLLEIRRTGGDPTMTTTSETSEVVKSDRTTDDVFRTDVDAALVIEDEWVYSVHDKEMEDVFGAVWAVVSIDGVAGDISAVASGNKYTSTTTDKFNSCLVGGHYRAFGFGTSGNNGVFRVVSRTTGASPEMVVAGLTLADETPAGTDAKFRGSVLRNGAGLASVSFEFNYTDFATSTNQFWPYLGAVAQQMVHGFTHPGKLTCSFNYLTAAPAGGADATIGSGSVTAYSQNRVMNSADHFSNILEGGAALTPCVQSLDLTIAAGTEERLCAGTFGPVAIDPGPFDVSGNLVVLNDEAGGTLAEKHTGFTASSLEWRETDPDDQGYVWFLPRLFYQSGVPDAGPREGYVTIPLGWTAVYDSTLGFQMQISSFPATAA